MKTQSSPRKMKTQSSPRNQRGFTFIELMMAVAIISVAIITIVSTYSSARLQSQIKTEMANMQAIVATAQGAFASQPNYGDLSNDILLKSNGFPSQMVNGTSVTNSWNGAVTVSKAGVPAAPELTKIMVTYDNTPTPACIALANALAKSTDQIWVAGFPMKLTGGALVDAVTLAGRCGVTATVTFNAIFAG